MLRAGGLGGGHMGPAGGTVARQRPHHPERMTNPSSVKNIYEQQITKSACVLKSLPSLLDLMSENRADACVPGGAREKSLSGFGW